MPWRGCKLAWNSEMPATQSRACCRLSGFLKSRHSLTNPAAHRLNEHAFMQVECNATKFEGRTIRSTIGIKGISGAGRVLDNKVLKSGATQLNKRAKNMKRDFFQRKAYAMGRMSLAIDRVILATTPADYKQACKWVNAWGIIGKIRRPEQAPTRAETDRKLQLVALGVSHIN